MSENNSSIKFLYGTALGRGLLRMLLKGHLDGPAVRFLRSGLSRKVIRSFARKNGIKMTKSELKSFPTYREFFLRDKKGFVPSRDIDMEPSHLISPCDSWLSAYQIEKNSTFRIKGSQYRLNDFLGSYGAAYSKEGAVDPMERFIGGDCLIFRLCASDYHHYCYIDDCFVGASHYIPGELHSVQPLACETYPVYTLNRRNWCLMETVNFGPVIQSEVGALIVGGIINHHEEREVKRGEEKGYFDLAGSTIVLIFEKGRIKLRPEILSGLEHSPEVRVEIGTHIGDAVLQDA